MRILPGILCVACCLTVLGCNLPKRGSRSPGASPASRNPQPFLGTPPGNSSSSPASPDTNNLTSGRNPSRRSGVLAGRILDQDNRLRPEAIIQVIDLDAAQDGSAPLSVKANRDGYFDIAGLEAGHSYRLVARVKDGVRILVGSRRVVPPDIRVAIYLTEELPANDQTGVESPALPPPAPPPSGPTASLGLPIRSGDGVTTPLPGSPMPEAPGPGGSGLPPAVSTQADPSLIAGSDSKTVQDGFTREVPSPRVTIPNAPGRDYTPEKPSVGPYAPPPPPMSGGNIPGTPLVPSSAPSATPALAPPSGSVQSDLPVSRTVVPSCVRVGNRVENFALYDVQGNVFEFAHQRKGKLVLLDFWFTDCLPCRRAIPKLNSWQSKYGPHGLEVIGITREKGTLAEKQRALALAKKQFGLNINYRLLFAGGGSGKCPVADQLEVFRYPTLILLDENGKILSRVQGMDDYSAYQLEMTIYRHLFGQRLASRP